MKNLLNKKELYRDLAAVSGLCAFLEGDLSLFGSPISVVHCEYVKNAVGSSFVMQSVKVNPSLGAAAQVEPHLRGGFLQVVCALFHRPRK